MCRRSSARPQRACAGALRQGMHWARRGRRSPHSESDARRRSRRPPWRLRRGPPLPPSCGARSLPPSLCPPPPPPHSGFCPARAGLPAGCTPSPHPRLFHLSRAAPQVARTDAPRCCTPAGAGSAPASGPFRHERLKFGPNERRPRADSIAVVYPPCTRGIGGSNPPQSTSFMPAVLTACRRGAQACSNPPQSASFTLALRTRRASGMPGLPAGGGGGGRATQRRYGPAPRAAAGWGRRQRPAQAAHRGAFRPCAEARTRSNPTACRIPQRARCGGAVPTFPAARPILKTDLD